jgi:alkanesulfonate monooxygenase SsuD/methylene tetrahydromethanopterin reductase-like flavin-dependent oxidoreductase (luciferase family)
MSVVKIGVSLPMSGDRNVHGAPSLIAVAQRAEELGLDAVSVSDVLLGDGTPAVESVVAAAAVATATSRVSVEFGVLVLPIRQVALLAAQIAGLQHLSNNGIVLGVGAGGFPTSPFWRAVDGPEHDRGAVTDAMLKGLPTVHAPPAKHVPTRSCISALTSCSGGTAQPSVRSWCASSSTALP